MENEKINVKNEARERAALMDDPNYKRFAEAAEVSADKIRNMSDYEYREFISKLREARVTKMPWYKRAWHAVTDDVDAAMAVWMIATLGTAAGVGVAVGKAAKKNAVIELKNHKKRLEENFNYEKQVEAEDNVFECIRENMYSNEDRTVQRGDVVYMDASHYNQLVSDANINISELRSIVGATDIPTTNIYKTAREVERIDEPYYPGD